MKFYFIVLLILFVFSCSDEKIVNDKQDSEFCSDINNMPEGVDFTYVRIIGILPNPIGDDYGKERILVKNFKKHTYFDFGSYSIFGRSFLRMDAEIIKDTFDCECRVLNLAIRKEVELPNEGYEVRLEIGENHLVQTVSYEDAKEGEWIYFDGRKK